MRKTLVIYLAICSCIPFSVCGQPVSPQQTTAYRKAKDSLLTDLTKRKSKLNYQADTGYIKALVVLGNVMFSLNNIDSTLILSRQSLVLAEKINEYRGIFYSLINLSKCNNRRPDTALAYLSQASKVIEKMNVPGHRADAYSAIGKEYMKFPDVSDLRTEYFLKALKIYETIGDKKDIANGLVNTSAGYRARRSTPEWKEKLDKALEYAFRALKVSETQKDKNVIIYCTKNIANIYSSYPDWASTIEYNLKVIGLMKSVGNKHGLANEYLQNGNCYVTIGSIPMAMENFFNSLKISESLKDTGQIRSVLMRMATVYADQGKYAEARNYFLKADALLDANATKNMVASSRVNIARTYYLEKRYPEALESFFTALKQFEEMGPTAGGIAVCSYNIADIYMAQGNYNDALKYSLKAKAKFEELKWPSQQYYGNLGKVYLGLKQYDSALLYANKFYSWAQVTKGKSDLRDANELLSNIYEATGDGMKSLNHQKQFKLLADSLFNQETEKKTAYLSASYEFSQKEDSLKYKQQLTNEQLQKQVLLTKQQEQEIILKNQEATIATKEKDLKHVEFLKEKAEKQEKEKQLVLTQKEKSLKESELNLSQTNLKKQKIIRNVTIAGLAGLMLFSIVVIRQRNRVRKEKKRSDELLLNILPAETAEELKRTGTTSAKNFNEVTILFTDFKNFTAVSEKLSAQELVNEINYCYSAFDKIITKYGIEKIKTIGDSYMCAGGLPVENKTNAADTVQAAIEIRDFINNEKKKREAEGKTYFEIRIGCNTGSVVAGIVGIKKFAYDIWGDAVNIASRMESSGLPGKVNISNSTYELVKDKFACTYRGKIEAKNKGEVDMYFAEGLFH